MNVGDKYCHWCGGKGFIFMGVVLFKNVLTSYYEPCFCLQEGQWIIDDIKDQKDLYALFEEINSSHLIEYIIIDEVQNIESWEKFIV